MVAAMAPQGQAERLLQYAISHHVGATDEIKARVNGWRGAIAFTPGDQHAARRRAQRRRPAGQGRGHRDRAGRPEHRQDRGASGRAARTDCAEPAGRATGNLHAGTTRQPRHRDRPHPRRAPPARAFGAGAGAVPGVRRDREHRHRRHGRAIWSTAFHHDPSCQVRIDGGGCGLAHCGMLTRAQRMLAIPGLLEMVGRQGARPRDRGLRLSRAAGNHR